MRLAGRLRILLLVLLLVAPAAFAKNTCTKGSPEPVSRYAPTLRPTQTAQCSYGYDELFARITKLLVDRSKVQSVEAVEKAFGMPSMTTAFDDPHDAMYSMLLYGKDGWSLSVYVRESARRNPRTGKYAPGPDAFGPGARPERIESIENMNVFISLEPTNYLQLKGTENECIQPPSLTNQLQPPSPIFDALVKDGWKDISAKQMPTDGGSAGYLFEAGNKTLSINTPQCGWPITLRQSAIGG
jgi:hypothetical protein